MLLAAYVHLLKPFSTCYIQTVHMKLSVKCDCHEYSSHTFGSMGSESKSSFKAT